MSLWQAVFACRRGAAPLVFVDLPWIFYFAAKITSFCQSHPGEASKFLAYGRAGQATKGGKFTFEGVNCL
jgi:hypothetical protein